MLVGLPTYGPLTAMSAMTFDSSPFPVAKLSLYSACSSGGKRRLADGGRMYFCDVCPVHCNLHDLLIEFSACLERRLLKRRTTVTLSDLASRTYAGVEPINLSRT